MTGLVATFGGRSLYVPIEQVGLLGGAELRLTSAQLDLRQFERRDGEVLLRADVLGHRLIDVESAQLIRAGDLELAPGTASGSSTGSTVTGARAGCLGAARGHRWAAATISSASGASSSR